MLDEKRKIGVGLTALGIFFLILGVVFLFDRGLLAMGNLLFIIGVAMTIGAQSTVRFFLRPKNYKGTGFFMGGIILVVWGWTLIGFALEAYGFWQLFSGFFPTALSFLRRMPFLRQILDAPAFKSVRDAWSVSAFLCLLMSQHMKYKFHSPKMVQVINRIAPPGGLPV